MPFVSGSDVDISSQSGRSWSVPGGTDGEHPGLLQCIVLRWTWSTWVTDPQHPGCVLVGHHHHDNGRIRRQAIQRVLWQQSMLPWQRSSTVTVGYSDNVRRQNHHDNGRIRRQGAHDGAMTTIQLNGSYHDNSRLLWQRYGMTSTRSPWQRWDTETRCMTVTMTTTMTTITVTMTTVSYYVVVE